MICAAELTANNALLLADEAILVFPGLPDSHYFHNGYGVLPSLYTILFNALCLPSLCVPMGRDERGYPVSVQLVAHPDHEFMLMDVARRMKAEFGGAVLPEKR